MLLGCKIWLILYYVFPSALSHLAWTNTQTSFTKDQVDLWTQSPSGCPCKGEDFQSTSCACCVEKGGGCPCGERVPNRCGQCGLETYCDNMCNITISSREMMIRSGRPFGEIESPLSASGPIFCWYRLVAEPGERIELQIYRIKRLGKLDLERKRRGFIRLKEMNESNSYFSFYRCVGGTLKFISGNYRTKPSPLDISVCGENERYSPPIVIFKDFDSREGGTATLAFKVDESTSRSQFLAHYAFVPNGVDKFSNISAFSEDTRLRLRGGIRLPGSNSLEQFLAGSKSVYGGDEDYSSYESGCDWAFEERMCSKKGYCGFSSPGFPGIYSPNRACKYLIRKDESSTSKIKLTFTHFNLPPNLCVEHFVSIYDGDTIRDPILETLCGYVSNLRPFLFDGPSILVEFSDVLPPFHFNGFAVDIEFIKEEPVKTSYYEKDEEKDSSFRSNKKPKSKNRNRNKDSSPSSSPLSPLKEDCEVIFREDGSRSGFVSSAEVFSGWKHRRCRMILRGHRGDVVKILIHSLKLRGKDCESYLKISTPSMNFENREVRNNQVGKICSPDTRKSNQRFRDQIPLLVNSSIVFLDFKYSGKSRNDKFEAFFEFHNVLTEGHPVPNSTCDTIYSSYGDSPLRGPLKTFGDSELFRRLRGFVRCSTALVPQQDQSVIVKIKSLSRISNAMTMECETTCNENGCACLSRRSINDVNHILVAPFNGGNAICLCGNFTDLLPLKVISSTSLVITYNSGDYEREAKDLFLFGSTFNFNDNIDDLCFTRNRINQPEGTISSGFSKRRKLRQGSQNGLVYYYSHCRWFFDVGQRILVSIKTSTKHYDCSTWNISLIPEWSRNSESNYLFCPEDVSKDYLLNSTKITLSLSSLSPFPPDYSISWRPWMNVTIVNSPGDSFGAISSTIPTIITTTTPASMTFISSKSTTNAVPLSIHNVEQETDLRRKDNTVASAEAASSSSFVIQNSYSIIIPSVIFLSKKIDVRFLGN